MTFFSDVIVMTSQK